MKFKFPPALEGRFYTKGVLYTSTQLSSHGYGFTMILKDKIDACLKNINKAEKFWR